VTLHVPALRERVDDIPLLAEHFLPGPSATAPPRRLSAEARDLVRAYSWPGNVRQLENTIRRPWSHRARPRSAGPRSRPCWAASPRCRTAARRHGRRRKAVGLGGAAPEALLRPARRRAAPARRLQRILREVETPLIEIALDATAGNQAKCADLLGINRNTLRKKITDLDIRVTRRRKLM
jgi:two-component system, NtrC family, nitrogen regulation response regulator GlnG